MSGAESSFVSEVKENQYQHPILLELRENVHKKRMMTFFEQEEDGALRYQGRMCD